MVYNRKKTRNKNLKGSNSLLVLAIAASSQESPTTTLQKAKEILSGHVE